MKQSILSQLTADEILLLERVISSAEMVSLKLTTNEIIPEVIKYGAAKGGGTVIGKDGLPIISYDIMFDVIGETNNDGTQRTVVKSFNNEVSAKKFLAETDGVLNIRRFKVPIILLFDDREEPYIWWNSPLYIWTRDNSLLVEYRRQVQGKNRYLVFEGLLSKISLLNMMERGIEF